MADRPRTTWKCRWVPRRTRQRRYTAQDAARIVCRVTRDGGTLADVVARYRVVCAGERPEDRTAAEQALAAAQANILANESVLGDAYRTFQLINGLLSVVALLGRIIPALRVHSLAAAGARQSIAAQSQQIQQQQAANQSTFAIVQRAAANEARFRQTGTF